MRDPGQPDADTPIWNLMLPGRFANIFGETVMWYELAKNMRPSETQAQPAPPPMQPRPQLRPKPTLEPEGDATIQMETREFHVSQ